MKYIEFQSQFKEYPLVSLSEIRNIFPSFDQRRLYEWQKNNYIKKLANNYYVFAERNFNEAEMAFIANKLYGPSYLSLEYALKYYSLIPEEVFLFTSVSTKKTNKLETLIGNFSYQKIKEDLFFGYRLIEHNKTVYKIAEAEKAILDFLYLRKDIRTENDLEELRINPAEFKEQVSQSTLKKYLKQFNNQRLKKTITLLLKMIQSND